MSRRFDPRILIVAGAFVFALIVGVALAANVALGVGLVFAAAYVLVLAMAPVWALVAFVPLIFLGAIPALNLGGKAAGLFVAAAWIGAALTRRDDVVATIRRDRHMFELIVALVLWMGLTALWATDPGRAVGGLWHWVLVGLLFAIIATWVTDERTLVWFCAAFVVGAVLAVLIGILTGAVGAGAAAAESRLEGGAGDPNFLAAGLVAAMVLAAGIMVARANLMVRLGCAVAIVICAVGIAATQSRGGLLALVGMILAALFVFRRRRIYVVVGCLAIVAVGAVYFSVTPAAWERITNVGNSGSGRTDLWSVAWRASEDHPLGGIGLDNYEVVAKDYTREPGKLESVNKIAERPHVVHNTFLEMLTETGIVGLLIFVTFILVCCRAAWVAGRRFEERGDVAMEAMSRAILVGTIGMLIAVFFISAGVDRRLWALLALGPATLAIAERRGADPTAGSSPVARSSGRGDWR